MLIDDEEIRRTAAWLLAGSRTETRDLRLDQDVAYRIQDEAFCQRLERGERAAGIAARILSATDGEPTFVTSWLTDAMLDLDVLRQPPGPQVEVQVSAELGFVIGQQITDPLPSGAAALAAVDRVHGALHVRYHDAAQDDPAHSAATNGATACVSLGAVSAAVAGLDLQLEACIVEVNGMLAHAGTGAALLGHDPARALAATLNSFVTRGHTIEPGWVVLAGSLAAPVPAGPGTVVSARFTRLGAVGLRIPGRAGSGAR
ncbi:MAG: fumarylacetoacetate hydrolase family protein [Rhodococcus sp. (in: high G+C Gram-positive bacteria)]